MKNTLFTVVSMIAISVLAIIFLVWLIYFKEGNGYGSQLPFTEHLSLVNAILNFLSAVCVIIGIVLIKNRRRESHQKLMCGAFAFSILFLISYVVYHHFHGDTPFSGTGLMRPIYFFVLISHIGLSAVVLPMVLVTFAFAFSSKYTLHRKIASLTFPLWLYVSVTGVIVYLMLNHLPTNILNG
ncbi:TPA: DUF420 domain-containing protein [Candidatus Poribacteria bacterium]|nr:DUF420 domain-containing protein [Candidatus Poribacteria bacterium]HIC18173.1 DUF420 domain-containing protein [Candidatus Poribacteria bacterium]